MKDPIDARGLSCPQPVLLLKQALDKGPAECLLLVDSRAALENTARYAENAGYRASWQETNGEFLLTVAK